MALDSTQQAVADLQTIRRAIERSESVLGLKVETTKRINRASLQVSKLIITGALILSSIFLIIELMVEGGITPFGLTSGILQSKEDLPLRVGGVRNVGLFICALLGVLYAAVSRAAKESEQDFDSFVIHNFIYLRNLSFISDVFVRYVVFAMLIFTGRPEWIAPLFFIFIGDFLVQGKFFYLPLNVALVLGVISFIGAGTQFVLESSSLVWPLAIFLLASAVSAVTLNDELKK